MLILLVIILCTVLIPGSKRGPQFELPPTVNATGDTWIDINVQLDSPGIVSFMVFRQADLGRQLPGSTEILSGIIAGAGVHAGAVAAAPFPDGQANGSVAASSGMKQMAVACAWRDVPVAHVTSVVSIWSVAPNSAHACGEQAAGRLLPDRRMHQSPPPPPGPRPA